MCFTPKSGSGRRRAANLKIKSDDIAPNNPILSAQFNNNNYSNNLGYEHFVSMVSDELRFIGSSSGNGKSVNKRPASRNNKFAITGGHKKIGNYLEKVAIESDYSIQLQLTSAVSNRYNHNPP